MLLTLFLFFLSAAVIYFACEYFVNGVEWVGHRFELGATATGTVLAAFGTALPESAVTFMAVVFGDTPEQKDIGVGAAMGGPLVLATLAYAVVGLACGAPTVAARRNGLYQRGPAQTGPRPAWFMGIFVFKVGLGLLAFAWKPWLGILFLVTYGLYVKRELSNDEESLASEDLEPLCCAPRHGSRAVLGHHADGAGAGGDRRRVACVRQPDRDAGRGHGRFAAPGGAAAGAGRHRAAGNHERADLCARVKSGWPWPTSRAP